MYYSPIQTKSPATNQFAKVNRQKPGIIEKGFIHKRRQRSSLLFGVRIDSIPCPTGYFAPRWQVERDGFIKFFISFWCKLLYSSYHPCAIHPILQIVTVQNSWRGKKLNQFHPPRSSRRPLPSLLLFIHRIRMEIEAKANNRRLFFRVKWQPPCDCVADELIRVGRASVTLT